MARPTPPLHLSLLTYLTKHQRGVCTRSAFVPERYSTSLIVKSSGTEWDIKCLCLGSLRFWESCILKRHNYLSSSFLGLDKVPSSLKSDLEDQEHSMWTFNFL